MMLEVINMGSEADHKRWVETPENLRVGRYNAENNITMYVLISQDATQADIDAFWAKYPGYAPIP